MKISKEAFCRDYLTSNAAVARAVLPSGDRTIDEWQRLWRQALSSPTN